MTSPFVRRPLHGTWWEAYQQAVPHLSSWQAVPGAIVLLRKALAHCSDPVWRLWLWYRLAIALIVNGQREVGAAAIASGRRELATLDEPLPLAEAWFYAGEVTGAQLAGEWELSITLAQMGLGVLEAHYRGQSEEELMLQAQVRFELHRRLVLAMVRRADAPGVLAHFYAVLAVARRLNNRRYLTFVSMLLIDFAGRMGRLRLAWEMVDIHLRSFPPLNGGWAVTDWELVLSDLNATAGNLTAAADHLERAQLALARVDVPWPKPGLTNRTAFMAEARGDLDEAGALYGQALAEAEALGATDQAALASMGLLRLMLRQHEGVPIEAHALSRKMLNLAERAGSIMLRARAWHLRYVLDTRLGEWDDAHRTHEYVRTHLGPRAFPGVRVEMILRTRDLGQPFPDWALAVRQERHRADVRRIARDLLSTDLRQARGDLAGRLEALGDRELAAELRSDYQQPHPDTEALEAACRALSDALTSLPLGEPLFYEFTAKEANQDVQSPRRT